MLREAVILAGGFGTRLSHVLGNVPKPMAPVAGKPFLCYLLDRLRAAGIEHVALATGYMHSSIEAYFGNEYEGLHITYSQETEPLFTGGAIRRAAEALSTDDFIVVNGDTLFDIDLSAFSNFHCAEWAPISIALRQVPDTGRYGAVVLNAERVALFREKDESYGAGLINGGIYAINREWLLKNTSPERFSFEKDLLQPRASEGVMRAICFDSYFIDIGVPDDYHRAQHEFAALFPKDRYLFLDRDGVLNRRVVGDYVRNTKMWQWLPGALEAMHDLALRYQLVFVVSNQQGVGKGLFSVADLDEVHRKMTDDINAAGGRVDRIYVCTDLASANSPNRKPAIGMALQAKADYGQVHFTQSLMVGDSLTDLEFGYRCKMRCAFLTNDEPVPDKVRDYTDLVFCDLKELSEQI